MENKDAALKIVDGIEDIISSQKKKMLEANKLSAEFFNEYLQTKTDALDYLEKRACDSSIIKTFGLGFAPDKTDALLSHLKSKGFEAEFLEKAGLVSARTDGKGYIDKFRNRIIIIGCRNATFSQARNSHKN